MSGPKTEFHHNARRLPAVATAHSGDPEVEYYLSRITSVKSVDDLFSDDRLYRFAITAFGLLEMSEARAFMRRILSGGTGGAKAFMLELADQRLRDFAEAFDFAAHGLQTTQREAARYDVAERYSRIKLEAEVGRQDEGARLKLSFERKIAGVKSIYGVLGEADLYTVVRITLGLPAAQTGPEIDQQAAIIGAQLDLKEFADAERLAAFLHRFSGEWQRRRGTGTPPERVTSDPKPGLRVVSGDMLMSVQAMKTGSL